MKSIEDGMLFVKMVSDKQKWKLTDDKELLDMLVEGLSKNFNRYGYFSCPCRLAKSNRELDKDIICPCDYCVPDMKDFGHCYCGLYMSEDFFKSGKKPSSIPERRTKRA